MASSPDCALSHAELLHVLDSMSEGLQVVDREWRYLYLNQTAVRHARRSREELLGRTMQECFPNIEKNPVFPLLERCLNERIPAALVNEFTYPEGGTRNHELRIAPCTAGVLLLSIDVTDSLALESQLRQAQKMEAVGRCAGGVAHDFNNLLSVILSDAAMALEDLEPDSPIRSYLESIQEAGQRAATLTQQLLLFSRHRPVESRIANMNDITSRADGLLRRILGEDIQLSIHLQQPISSVRIDPNQFEQVIINLAVNARDAMPSGGRLTLETEEVYLGEDYARMHYDVVPGRYVMLAISDNGIGMDRETQQRIFEPFFTTKEVGKGTGLGLSMVFGIVKQACGHIWVYSEPNSGTTFRIYLPVAQESVFPVAQVREPTTLEGTETILLVEDQQEVRQVAKDILLRHGYRVIEALDAVEALQARDEHSAGIDLLLTDVVMPHLSGSELARRLLQIRPDLRVLYMSGYTERVVAEHGILESGSAYLQKPIIPVNLLRRVREVLDTPARTT